jgi:hypothetical protein
MKLPKALARGSKISLAAKSLFLFPSKSLILAPAQKAFYTLLKKVITLTDGFF